jgi:hypothetical protein
MIPAARVTGKNCEIIPAVISARPCEHPTPSPTQIVCIFILDGCIVRKFGQSRVMEEKTVIVEHGALYEVFISTQAGKPGARAHQGR